MISSIPNGEVFAIDDRYLPALQHALAQAAGPDGIDWQKLEAAFAAATPRTLPSSGVQTPANGRAIAVIPIEGGIFGEKVARIQSQLRQAAADPNVRAIVLDVNSPGGSVYGVDELANEIYQARAQKPIVAQVRPLAASAAYYLASQAHEVVGTPTSEMGSIGVWMMHVDASKALADYGVNISLISAGKYKTEGHPFGPLADDARAFMQSRVDEYYQMFLDAVGRGRGVSAATVRAGFGEGRVVGAKQAVQLGMADRVATMEQTLARLDATQVQVMPAAAAASAGGSAENPVAASPETQIPATAERTMEASPMPDTNTDTAAAVAQQQESNTRAAQIATLATTHGCTDKLAAWLKSGASVEAVQTEILGGLQAGARSMPNASTAVEVTLDASDKREKGVTLSRIARSLAATKGDKREAARFALTVLKDPVTEKYLALAASTGAAGGFTVPDVLAAEVIELLKPMTAVRSLNPTLAPLPNGALTLPGIAGGSTASYIGEQQNAPKSDMALRQVKLTAKKLAVLVPISNDLIRFASISADNMVRNDLVRAIAVAEDAAFIRGAGTAYSPKGMKSWAKNTTTANATVNAANVVADLKKLIGYLQDADVRMINCGFISNPRTFRYLQFLLDANSNFMFRDEIQSGRLLGYPFRATTLVPANLGGGTNESELYFADFADVVIGDVPTLVLEASDTAAYHDGTNVVAAFSRDETVIKMIVEHDIAVRHPESVAYLSAVLWS